MQVWGPPAGITVLSAKWFGDNVIELTFKDVAGRPGNQLVYREDEPRLEVVSEGRPWWTSRSSSPLSQRSRDPGT
jgi:hypothetical protein